MENLHNSVMINEIISFLPLKKSINVIDATFGGGGYSKTILEKFNVNQFLAIDRDPISKIFAKEIESKFSNFTLINDKFSKIEEIVNNTKFKDKKFDIILFDIGTSSNQIDNAQRGFSFNKSGPLDMRMGASDKNAYDIINNYEEKNLADIIYQYGEERYSRVIAKEIVKNRKIKFISDTIELSNIIKKCLPKKNQLKNKIHPATKTFQAIRIYVNDELNELKTSLEKTLKILNKDGLILVVSFQSLEDRIVKDFFNHNSGKRWRSSRHYPELPDKLATQLKIITKKPILPSASEILENPRSRSAKLRVAQKI
ncbi:MAG: ribosomal RNA small subunit methyltransferase H [Candidatus Pelagibacterales bacterium]|nr:MAG: ribosomal RNA small subunit methyltransferase H [Pelagibacterales bacterium]